VKDSIIRSAKSNVRMSNVPRILDLNWQEADRFQVGAGEEAQAVNLCSASTVKDQNAASKHLEPRTGIVMSTIPDASSELLARRKTQRRDPAEW
jgi:hypothetical protein